MAEQETQVPTDVGRVKRKGKKKVKRAKAASTESLLEDRLAAIGEAFMSSIEGFDDSRNGGASSSKRRCNSASLEGGSKGSSAPANCKDEALGVSSKKKRRKRGASASASQVGTGSGHPGTGTTVAEVQSQAPAGRRESVMVGGAQSRPVVSAADKRRFMSGKVSAIRSKANQGRTAAGASAKEEQEAEFNKTLREVLEFVTPNLGKHEKRQWEEAKIRALGGTIEKRQPVAYNILQRERKSARATIKEAEANRKQTGLITSEDGFAARAWARDSHVKKKKLKVKDIHKRRDEFNLLRLGMGAREKRGLVTISKTQLRRRMGRGTKL